MESLDYSDSEESSCSSGSSSVDSVSKDGSIQPKFTDIGKRVVFTSGHDKKEKYGILRYVGVPEFSEGVWCGVVLDQPTGKNNGSVHGIRYFMCEPNCGMFVPINKVEIDTRSRRMHSRPNSQPSSRASSVERNGLASAPSTPRHTSKSECTRQPQQQAAPPYSSSTLGRASKISASFQKNLVNRLTQPHKRSPQQQQQNHSQQLSSSGGRRQPMKAFATKGTEKTTPAKESSKPLMPFRKGGMYKASSSDNLRSMKDKDKVGKGDAHKGNQGKMPAKKSSSERDLRNSGKSVGTGFKSGKKSVTVGFKSTASSSPTVKSKRKQNRINSCSDMLDSGPSASPTTTTTTTTTQEDVSENLSARKLSCDSHPYLKDCSWSKTSTPGNRDELTPDGCSSPEETDDSVSKSKHAVAHSLSSQNNGFLIVPPMTTSAISDGETGKVGKEEELTTQVSSPSLPNVSVHSSSEGNQTLNNQCNGGRLSGTASSSLITDGTHLLKNLLGPNQSVRTYSVTSHHSVVLS